MGLKKNFRLDVILNEVKNLGCSNGDCHLPASRRS